MLLEHSKLYRYQLELLSPYLVFHTIYFRAIFLYTTQTKEHIRRPMSNSYLTFFYIIGYITITHKTKESILEKEIEANLDSINDIIIAISYVIMNSIEYFQTNRNLKDTLGYIKFWYFLPNHTSYKSLQLEESQTWKTFYEEPIKYSVSFCTSIILRLMFY